MAGKRFDIAATDWAAFVGAVVAETPSLANATDEQKDLAAVAKVRTLVSTYVGKINGKATAAQVAESLRTNTTVTTIEE